MIDEIQFDGWLKEFAMSSTDPLVRASEKMVKYLFELDNKLPSRYGWRVTSAETFQRQLANMTSANEVNRLYWHDMASGIEAHGVMVVWRATELIKPALHALNSREVLAPAILSRSLLELASCTIVNGNSILSAAENIKASSNMPNAVVASSELEQLLLRMIHGTRIGQPPNHLKQTNILSYIQKVSKNPDASKLMEIYECLCDVAHPNALGNARFWAAVQSKDKNGSETVRMERRAESPAAGLIREEILWALGWSSACIRNGFEMGQEVVRVILNRWP
jgi:hypothetical protein